MLGDIIDILSVVATMFGVCTSLGLGVIQLNYGFRRINRKVEISTGNQIITIWGITALATASVISGIKLGIRRLSEICFAIGKAFLMPCFVGWPNSEIAKDVKAYRDRFCIDNRVEKIADHCTIGPRNFFRSPERMKRRKEKKRI